MFKVRVATLSVLGTAMCLGGVALAADTVVPTPPPAPPPVVAPPPPAPAPAFSWTGFYAGLNIGYAFGGLDAVGISDGTDIVGLGTLAPSGIFGGVQLGFNFQTGSIVLGIEADAQLTNIGDTFDYDLTGEPIAAAAPLSPGDEGNVASRVQWLASLRARVGLALDRTLLYVTGGVGAGQNSYTITPDGGSPENLSLGTDSPQSDIHIGLVGGAGVEHAFSDSISVEVEYLYYLLGNGLLEFPTEDLSTVPTLNFHTVKFGLNFLF